MKRFYGIILLFTALTAFNTNVFAYPCAGITVQPIGVSGGTNTTDNYGVRVTLDKSYSEDITVNGTMFYQSDRSQHPTQTFSVTVTAGNTTAETGFVMGVPLTTVVDVETTSVSPLTVTSGGLTYSTQSFLGGACGPNVTASGNVLKFFSLDVYEEFADNLLDRSELTNAASQSSSLTTLEEANPGANDTVYADFLRMILNTDYIVEIGEFLVKIDLANDRALIIQSSNSNAYNSLVNNSTSATGMMVFSNSVSNTLEVLHMIANQTLSVANYQSAQQPNTNFRSCGGARSKKHTDPNLVWASGYDPNSTCPNFSQLLAMDNKVVYQNSIIYFSLQAKIKSIWGCSSTNWVAAPTYPNVNTRIISSASFKKRCGTQQNLSFDQQSSGSEFNWRAYESSRSLSEYNFTADYKIKLTNSNTWTSSPTYNITD